jgi:hypothetical protein
MAPPEIPSRKRRTPFCSSMAPLPWGSTRAVGLRASGGMGSIRPQA